MFLCFQSTIVALHKDGWVILSIIQVVVVGDKVIKEDDWISLNGSTGEVILGKQALAPPALSGDLETFMSWADQIRHLKVLFHLSIKGFVLY